MTDIYVASLRQVTHHYGDVTALNDISLDIPAQKMVGLIGPDGVGKSTLLALIAGVKIIQQGEIQALNGNIADHAYLKQARMRIAYMPQGLGRNLYPTLSVFDNIDFFGRLFGQNPDTRLEKIKELLVATSMDSFRDRPAGKLSGGMKQKLSLCCALMNDPDLLILDEPTTGVDPLSRRQFWELINNIRSRRPWMSVLVATAYLDEAEGFDWLVAMDEGKVIDTGTPAELIEKTQTKNLDEAFIALLPEEKRHNHQSVVVPPRIESDDAEPVIVAEHLTRKFGSFVAVDNVSFRIGKGEIFGFLGSNGCGKSTTMKMLTGLLPASSGTAQLFGRPVSGSDLETRKNVGYMSQSFSLYTELTVRQNLDLHAQLYHIPPDIREERIQRVIKRFELTAVADARPDQLPLGIKQRLQLAVAVLHNPPLLILDEPTSGVDPVARDSFWQFLIDLSRNDGVTIFISTHFMNEAARCDRISLMHAGKVLTVGKPDDIARERGEGSLEKAFIGYLEEASGLNVEEDNAPSAPVQADSPADLSQKSSEAAIPVIRSFDFRRLWAYSRRELMELLRDPIRMIFAFIGPVILMIAFGYGISFDINDVTFTVLDQDRTPESRELIENISSSPYFTRITDAVSIEEAQDQMLRGKAQVIIEIPTDFGKHMLQGKIPEISVSLNGSMPSRAETIKGYIGGITAQYAQQVQAAYQASSAPNPVTISNRFRYNQAFESLYAMVPCVIMLMLMLTPSIMAAIAVVREKETGSIANFQSTPITKMEFLVGKQLPYIGVAMVEFFILLLLAIFLFNVPVRGSFMTLLIGTLFYVSASTAFGILISSFTRTQVAAILVTSIVSIVPAIHFSGLITPVSSLSGSGKLIGLLFPASYYTQVSVGTFTKSLYFQNLWYDVLILAVFAFAFMAVALFFQKKQEK